MYRILWKACTLLGLVALLLLQPNLEAEVDAFRVSFGARAAAQVDPELQIDTVQASLGDTVLLPVNFTGNGANIVGLQFSIDIEDQDGNNCLIYNDSTLTLPPGFESSTVTYDPTDTDGEIDVLIFSLQLPFPTLPDGPILIIDFTVETDPNCAGQSVPVKVSTAEPLEFTNTSGAVVPGTTVNGSVEVSPFEPDDCNGDGVVDAGDIPACVLEIFDGDGNLPENAPTGTFPGTSGCDANQDGIIDAADIVCTVLIIFNGPGSCAGPVADASALTAAELSMADGLTASADGRIAMPVMLSSNGHALSAATFAAEYDTHR